MERITLGQLLDLADSHMEEAESARRAGTNRQGVVRELGRVLSAITRCLTWPAGDAQVEVIAGTLGSRADRAKAGLQEALRQAGARIDAVRADLGGPAERSDPVAGHLAAAADALNAGCDLIGTHYGTRLGNADETPSNWARLIASEPVTAALRAEMARRAVRCRVWVDWLASQAPDYARTELDAARRWLTAADSLMPPGGEALTEVAIGEHLLRDVPLAAPPDRRIPTGSESPAELCTGITISADRLRVITSAVSSQDCSVTSATGPSWSHAARAAAIVSDLAARELSMLAGREASLDRLGVNGLRLRDAVNAFAQSCAAWQLASQLWRHVTTGLERPASATTADLDDLVLRMGRLASGNPRWTPARRDRAPGPSPVGLRPDELAAVLAAVHHAADALAWMASADLAMITAFGDRGYLYMPNRVLERPDASISAYVRLPEDRLVMLQDAYLTVANASHHAVRELDDLAIAVNAPSRTLGYARRLLGAGSSAPADGARGELDADAIAVRLMRFTRPSTGGGRARGSELDTLAVIRAYRDERQTLDQCAARFGVGPRTISAILQEHGVPRRRSTAGSSPRPVAPDAAPPAAPGSPAKPERGFMERRLLNAGIADSNLLARAAAFDKAADSFLAEAVITTNVLEPQTSQERKPRDPAAAAPALAAKDSPQKLRASAPAAPSHQGDPAQRQSLAPAGRKPARAPGRARRTS
ncbi:MAG TPA: hypothetical protein VN969_01480 [Streptosporangiaceae bacterium]|nr:hypothetical protein [Streptosporangiaceae bacterium]